MKRTTITLDDELEQQLAAFLRSQETAPSVTSVFQAALREFLQARQWKSRGYSHPAHPLDIPVAGQGSGRSDVSTAHDRYLSAPPHPSD